MSSIDQIRETMKEHDKEVGSRAIEAFVESLPKVSLIDKDGNYYDCVKVADIRKAMKGAK